MPDKSTRVARARQARRPVLLAIAGDSAAGKTTLSRGLVEALGPDRASTLCVDDYHRYDRRERRGMPLTPLHPEANYVEIMEQHLQLLAMGSPVLKPVYDHATGELVRPVLFEPKEFVIVEGLLPLSSKLSRACFDVTIFLDPPEWIRRAWKLDRDTEQRGYTAEQVLAELERRAPEAAAYIRPQRAYADIVVRFCPIEGRDDPPETPLSAELLLRPTIRHPDVSQVIGDDDRHAMHLKLVRDADGRPVDALHVHGYASPAESAVLEKAIWSNLSVDHPMPETLGRLASGERSAPLALTQLLILYHLLDSQT